MRNRCPEGVTGCPRSYARARQVHPNKLPRRTEAVASSPGQLLPHALQKDRRPSSGGQTCSPVRDSMLGLWFGAQLMRRREFIGGIAGAAGLSLTARAQQSDRIRRLGVLMPYEKNDHDAEDWLSGFIKGLQVLGWTDGRNVKVEVRWAFSNDEMRMAAKDLVDLPSDAILVGGTPGTAAVHRQTLTIPIVFVNVVDPIGPGFVTSLPRPGGNITGFINVEAAMTSKWLELLREIAPNVKRVAIMFNPDTAPYVIPVPDRIGLAAPAELGSRKSTEALQMPRVIVSLVSKHRLRPRFNPFWSWY